MNFNGIINDLLAVVYWFGSVRVNQFIFVGMPIDCNAACLNQEHILLFFYWYN